MASYKGVQGALIALESFFKLRLPVELSSGPTNARATLLGSSDIANKLTGNLLGIYLHRVSIDDHGRARYFHPKPNDAQSIQAELPVNLHFLLIANATSAVIEADLMSWAMVEMANHNQLDISHVQDIDDEWGESEVLNITPEEMSNEDLMRIWDVFDSPFTLTKAYIAKTIRLRLAPEKTEGPVVDTRVFPMGRI